MLSMDRTIKLTVMLIAIAVDSSLECEDFPKLFGERDLLPRFRLSEFDTRRALDYEITQRTVNDV